CPAAPVTATRTGCFMGTPRYGVACAAAARGPRDAPRSNGNTGPQRGPRRSGLVAEQLQQPLQLVLVVEVELDAPLLAAGDVDARAGEAAEVRLQLRVAPGRLLLGRPRRRPLQGLGLAHVEPTAHDLGERPLAVGLRLGQHRTGVAGRYEPLLQGR